MTDLHFHPTQSIGKRQALRMYVVPIALLALAMLVSMTQAPWPVRIVAAVMLVTLPGAAVTALLFGEQADPAIRLPLTALLGLLLWLAVALMLNLAGISISAASLAIGVGLVGLPATIERQRRRIRSGRGTATDTGIGAIDPRAFGDRLKGPGAVVCSIAPIVVAIIVAVAIQPDHTERYTSLGFTDTGQFVEDRVDAAPGGEVRLNWAVRGYGYGLSTSSASVGVTIDGSPVDDLAVSVSPSTEPDEPGATSTVAGAVTFAAPATPGKHVVALTVVPAAADGTSISAPGFISTALEVK